MREAVCADAFAMAALHAAAFERPWSQEAFEGFLGDAHTAGLIGDHGFVLWRAVAGEAEILTLAVAPAVRRQGHGATLLTAALDAAARAGAGEMFLEVSAENEAAIGLYGSAGFEITGIRKGYYETANQPQDALTMRLALTAAAADTISDL